MTRPFRRTGILLLVTALLAGCAPRPGPVKPASPSKAMIYGHLDLPERVRDDWKRGISSKLSPKIGGARLLPQTPGAGPEPIPNFMNHSSVMTVASGTFSMERTSTATGESRVLKHILHEVQGTGWGTRIEARLPAIR